MSKPKDSPSSNRVRENQRRSRARRAELLNDLQTRVREYERQGIAASEEMQRAARVVAQENLRLRELLALRGVGHQEIAEHLKSYAERGTKVSVTSNSPNIHRTSEWHLALVSSMPQGTTGQGAHLVASSKPTTTDSSQISHPAPDFVPSLKSQDQYTHRAGPAEQVGSAWSAKTTTDDCPSSLSCYCPPVLEADTTSCSGLGISCEIAASIIADMRGDGDKAAARAVLGCDGPVECTVKSSVVMQLMDE